MSRKTDTREKILTVATDLFGCYGLNGVSTGQIAEKAGVNKALIFYHFKSKEDLYRTVFRERITIFRQRIDTIFKETEPGLPMIEAFVRTQIGFLSEHQQLARILIRELVDNEVCEKDEMSIIAQDLADVLKPLRNNILMALSTARTKGEMRDVDPIQTLVNIISLNIFFFLGQPILKIVNPQIASKEFQENRVEHVLDLLLNGLKLRVE